MLITALTLALAHGARYTAEGQRLTMTDASGVTDANGNTLLALKGTRGYKNNK